MKSAPRGPGGARAAFRESPRLEALEERVMDLPAWARSAVVGALLVLGITFYPLAARIIIPLLFVVMVLAEPRTAGMMALMFALATAGGAAAGFTFWLAKRWIRPIPVVGPYLAGMVAFFPYAVAVGLIVQLIDGGPVLARPSGAIVFAVGVVTVIFGAQLGHEMRRD